MNSFIVGNEYVVRLSHQNVYLCCFKKTTKTITFMLTEQNSIGGSSNSVFELQKLKLFKDFDSSNIEHEYIKWGNIYLFGNNLSIAE